jgi:acyl-coenzyme A thioesterase PaaI-like protein
VPFERSFDAQIGLHYERIEAHEVVGSFDVRPELLDAAGRLHGGVLTTVAEGMASMGTAAGVLEAGTAASGMSNGGCAAAACVR